jgi:hypothetical protein
MAQPSHSINVAQDYFSDLGGEVRIEKEVHCFGGGTGIACRGAVVWTQFYSECAQGEA